jgi:hypothetical protein
VTRRIRLENRQLVMKSENFGLQGGTGPKTTGCKSAHATNLKSLVQTVFRKLSKAGTRRFFNPHNSDDSLAWQNRAP